MNIHFIAIGGSAMHNLAIALHRKGYRVTGSDDEIFNPAKSRLEKEGLLPPAEGWFPENITCQLDAVVLGMHARKDNPELQRAVELGLKIYSYPEFLYEQSKNKLRVVIGGSHGKTSITAMILHVLKEQGVEYDYMVGAQLDGFDVMVELTETAPVMIIEGDEYLTSALDLRPKFHVYKPDIAVISGIAWDHMNVFPTFENYVEQFRIFAELLPPDGSLIYCSEDAEVVKLAENVKATELKIPYGIPPHSVVDGITYLETGESEVPLQIFGKHNLMNVEAARNVCNRLNVSDSNFYKAISTYKGANNRLEKLAETGSTTVFRDFAHAPSKLKATINAVKEQFPNRLLVACFELHTYSSLNEAFLHQYAHCMDEADVAIVYFSPHALELKKLPMLDAQKVAAAFEKQDLYVFTDSQALEKELLSNQWANANLLMMSSGNYDGIDVKALAGKIAEKATN